MTCLTLRRPKGPSRRARHTIPDRFQQPESDSLREGRRALPLAHEQEVAAVVAGLTHVRIFRRLLGGKDDGTPDLAEQARPVDHAVVLPQRLDERLGECGLMPQVV